MVYISFIIIAVAIATIVIGTYILFQDKRKAINRIYAYFCYSLGAYIVTTAGFYLASDIESFTPWLRINGIWPIPIALALHFTLVLTERAHLLNKKGLFLLYGPVLFITLNDIFFPFQTYTVPFQNNFGMWQTPLNTANPMLYIQMSWFVLMTIINVLIGSKYYLEVKEPARKQLTLYVVLCTSIPLFISFMLVYIIPLFAIIPRLEWIPISFFTAYALYRYNNYNLNSKIAAADIIRSMSNFLILVNKEEKITEINSHALSLLGYNAMDQVLHKPITSILNEADQERFFLDEPETNISNREVNLMDRNKNPIPVLISKAIIYNKFERIGYALIGSDLSELKAAQASLLEYNRKLMQSNEELKRFAHIASHDLQEPLRMVHSYVQLLDSRYKEAFDDTAREFMSYVVEGAQRMSDLIKGLLDYSRLDREDAEFESVDTLDIVEIVENSLRYSIKENNAKIKVESALPTLKVNHNQFIQLFQNLVSNAIKYRNEDIPPSIKIKAKENRNNWEFCIRDNGIGINENYHQKIFVIFQRLHGKKSKYQGTGIGLAICKRIVENHQGKIWVNSTEGDGTEFHFTISKTLN